MTLADLRQAASPLRSECIHIALARQALYVDLTAYRLTDPMHTPVFRTRKEALAYHPFDKQSDDLSIAAHPVMIEQGSKILWDGRPWRIAVGQTELTVVPEDGTPISLLRSTFDALVEEGKIVGAEVQTHSSITETGEVLLDRAREVDLATATFRNRVIHPEQYHDDGQVQLAAQIATIPARTKRRWRQWYREAEITYGSGYIGLLPHFTNRGGKRRMSAEVTTLIEKVLTTHYDTLTRKPKRGAYGEYVTQSKENYQPTVSQRTFYEQAKRHKSVYEQILVREGARAAYPFKEYHHSTEKTTRKQGNYAWSMAVRRVGASEIPTTGGRGWE